MQTDIFRKEAMSKFLRGDVPGAALTITPPWTIAVFGMLSFVLVALLALGVFGHAQVVAQGRGIVRPSQPPIVVHAPFSGTVQKILSKPGDDGKSKDAILVMDASAQAAELASCATQLGKENAELEGFENKLATWDKIGGEGANALVLLAQVRSQREKVAALAGKCDAAKKVLDHSRIAFPVDARVTDIAVSEGTDVREGDVIATLTPASAKLVGYAVLSETSRSEVETGQPVQLRFDAISASEVGPGHGKVVRVLDALPSNVKLDAPQETGGLFVELEVEAMPKGSGAARTGMTFGCDVLTRRPSILTMLFGT